MPGLCTFTLARFDRSRVPGLLATVPLERLRLRRTPGLAWGRHLGTSNGSGTLGADLARWSWFCCWDDAAAAARFHAELDARLRPAEAATLTLRTQRARGRWAGNEVPAPDTSAHPPPDGDADGDGPEVPRTTSARAAADRGEDGPLVVLTRARVRASRWRPFTGSIPPVDSDLGAADGRLCSLGMGEWPVLVQGTLSVWRDVRAMVAFSRTEAHRTAVRRTADEAWYAEELFARFSVVGTEGTWDGSPPLLGMPEPER